MLERITVFSSNNSTYIASESLEGFNRELIDGLWEIYSRYYHDPEFPEVCVDVAIESMKLGLLPKGGKFVTDLPEDDLMKRARDHAWSIDQSNRIYDLTGVQFQKKMINRLPSGIWIMEPGSRMYGRYIDSNSPIYIRLGSNVNRSLV